MSGHEVKIAQSKRHVMFVLGMHRSGTSALARMLNLLGCDLPRTLISESPANSSGFWESRPIMDLNDEILQSGGSIWHDWLPFNPDWYKSPVYAGFLDKGQTILNDEFASSPLFILKDPRCARLVPYWLDLFEREQIEPSVLIPIRSPVEVSKSINLHHHISNEISYLIWLRHVLDAEYETRALNRAFTSYDSLLENWTGVAVTLQDRLHIAWPAMSALSGMKVNEFLDPGMRHYQEPSDRIFSNPLLTSWIRDSYAIMLRWCADGESADDYEALDVIRREFNAAGPAFVGIAQSLIDETRRAHALHNDLQETKNALLIHQAQAPTDDEHSQTLVKEYETKYQRALADLEESTEKLHTELRVIEGTAERATSEANELRGRLAQLESTLLQRAEEIEQTISERESALHNSRALEAERTEIRGKLKMADEWVFRLAAERQAAQAHIDDLMLKLKTRDQVLVKANAEIQNLAGQVEVLSRPKVKVTGYENEAGSERQKKDVPQEPQGTANFDDYEAKLASKASINEFLNGRLDERAQEIVLLTNMLIQVQQKFDRASTRVRECEDELAATGAINLLLNERLDESSNNNRILSMRFNECSDNNRALSEQLDRHSNSSRMLSEQLVAARQASSKETREKNWLRKIIPVINSTKWRHRMLTRDRLVNHVNTTLLKMGVFDADAYMLRYPDVAEEGMSALDHYVKHGMDEDRVCCGYVE